MAFIWDTHVSHSQLLKVIEDWINAIDSGASVDVIYLDYQKALDRVPHGRLMSKVNPTVLRDVF